MPKRDTRRLKALELLHLVQDGPSLSHLHTEFTTEEATRQVRTWLQSWVEPLVRELVPELKKERPKS
jgi:hypothetical protein